MLERLQITLEHKHIDNEVLVRRFWSHVNVGAEDECWEWIGGARDYKNFGLPRSGTVLAHRFSKSIELCFPVSDSDCVLHACDNPPCVNPNHLFLGSRLDNAQDAVAKGRWPKNRGRAKLTEEVVREIRRLYAIPKYPGFVEKMYSTIRLAKMFNVSSQNISCIINYQSWKDVC